MYVDLDKGLCPKRVNKHRLQTLQLHIDLIVNMKFGIPTVLNNFIFVKDFDFGRFRWIIRIRSRSRDLFSITGTVRTATRFWSAILLLRGKLPESSFHLRDQRTRRARTVGRTLTFSRFKGNLCKKYLNIRDQSLCDWLDCPQELLWTALVITAPAPYTYNIG